MRRRRLSASLFAFALATAPLAACAPESEAADADTRVQAAETPAPDVADAPVPVAAEAPREGAPPAGYYECHFYGTYGLQVSSMVSMRIHSATDYEAMESRGAYRFDPADRALRMESGPLEGRVARMKESDGKPAIVFVRTENEVDGKPTIDISDTWCYFKPGGSQG